MPRSVYALALGVFAMVTSEFAVAGLMPQLAVGLDSTIPEIGYLVAVFALAMALGGPPIAGAMLRLPSRTSLLILLGGFFLGNLLAAVSTDYWVMVLARLATGAASGAFFGVAVTMAGTLVPAEQRVRAIGTTMQGLMLGTTLGLPFATWLGGQWGWRTAFVAIGVLAAIVALVIQRTVPHRETAAGGGSMRGELGVFRSVRLWGTLITSTLVIAATFGAFSYFTPVLNEVTGIPLSFIPWLLMMYGGATVLGNAVVARLASGNPLPVLVTGISLNAVFLAAFAVAAGTPWLAIPAMMGIGLVGVTMNPALVNRVQRVGNAGTLVNTVHGSMITLGVVVGSTVGGIGIEIAGLRAPLWIGMVLAVLALITVIPDRSTRVVGAASRAVASEADSGSASAEERCVR